MMDRLMMAIWIVFPLIRKKNKQTVVRVWHNFLDPRVVANIDGAHVGPRIVHED